MEILTNLLYNGGKRRKEKNMIENMKKAMAVTAVCCLLLTAFGCGGSGVENEAADQALSADDSSTLPWTDLFTADLSNAVYPEGVWHVDDDGILTADEDQAIWTGRDYDNFVLDLEFMTAAGTNSGVIVYCSDMENWIPNSVEIQIADDYAEQWASQPATWHCGAIFGHLAPTRSVVKPAGEWNHYVITCRDQNITVKLNGEMVTEMDMSLWTSSETNPDGSEIPDWLSKPKAELATRGRIGLQGKHAGAPIYFRNLRIKELQ
jgi:hypothetical protein